ncbi:MAG: hypothetical protein N2254_08230 [bacterium]|nr:hypothetical protein [bacterium]
MITSRNRIKFFFVAILCLILFEPLKCKKKEESIDDIIRNGVSRLQEQDWAGAAYHFSRAIEKDPKNPKARMGMAITQTGVLFKQIEKVVIEIGNIIVQLIGGFSPRLKFESENDQPSLNDIVYYIVDSNIIQPISNILENSEIAANSNDDWSLYIEGLTWTVKFRDTVFWQIELTGEVDRTDAALLSSLFRLAETVLKILISIDIHLDVRNFARIYNYIEDLGGISAIQENPRIVVLNIIPFILNDRETFLGVEPKRGLKYMKEDIPNAIRKMSEYGILFYDYITNEKDNQEDDIIAYESEEETGEKLGKLSFPTSSTYFYDPELTERKGRTVASVNIPPPDLKYFFENMAKSIDGSMVKWGDIIEITSFLIVAILKTGIFDSIISNIVSVAGSAGLPPNIIQNLGNIINPGFISGIIKGIIPDQIGFSLKPVFEKPISIRDILPAWTEDHRFILEWECISDSPRISPLAEDNPVFIFFCKYPKTRYCFRKSEKRCNIRYLECLWTPLSPEEKVCENYCGEDCGNQETPQEICTQRNEQECIRFCIEKEDLKNIDGTFISSQCNGNLIISDSEHFSNISKIKTKNQQPEPLPRDGISSIVPYILLQSPNLYGFLYINKDFLRTSIPAQYRANVKGQGYQLPDMFEINIFIQIVGKNLTNLLSQFGIM